MRSVASRSDPGAARGSEGLPPTDAEDAGPLFVGVPPAPESKPRRIARAAAAVAVAIGALGILGWLLDASALRSIAPGWVSIRPFTAVAMILLGLTPWLVPGGADGRRRWPGHAAAFAAILLGLLALAEHLFHLAPAVDDLLFPARLGAAAVTGRMALTTAIAFVLLGVAELAGVAGGSAAAALAEGAAVLAGTIAGVVLTGYAFGVAPHEAATPSVPMAVNTAIGLAALAVAGVAGQPRSRLVRILSSEPPGGTLVRRLLPALLVTVFVLQWLGLAAERGGLYGSAVGYALQLLTSVVLLSALVLWSATAVNRTVLRRQQAEAELRDNQDRLRAVFEHAGVGLAYIAPDGRFLQVNQRLCDILGYASYELLTRSFQDVTHPAHVGTDVAQLERLAAGEGDSYATEKRYLRKDGSEVWVGLTSAAVRGADGRLGYFVSAFHEIADRRLAENRLRESEASYRRLVENSTIGIFRSSVDGTFLAVNPALAAMLGYDAVDDVLRLDILRDVYVRLDERAGILLQLEHRPVATGEVQWRRRDGGAITVRLRLRRARDESGATTWLEGLAEDVTQQRALENQFRQAQRLEAVGRLAGGVAHDFNNILTAITGYSDMLLEELHEHDHKRQDVEEIRTAAARATSLTRQLLAFSRKQVLQARVLDLNALVGTLERMLQRLIGEDVELATALARDLGPVRADPGQLEQIIMNLAVNARDAMPSGGRLTIETANVELDDDYAQQHADAAPGSYVLLAVSDTGTGMDAETRSHLFEPFFTTKEQGKGTGLGLATVYGIVKQSGGHILVYSEPGRGTTFKIYLPRVPEPVEAPPLAQAEQPAEGGRETVLLAEDDPAVREIASVVLSRRGYRVLRAPDGQTALEMARAHAGDIQILVTDIIMPGMTGRDLAEALAAERAGVRVLYMSGYTDDAVVRHGVLEEGLPYLQKPFTPEDLAHKVRDVLDQAPPAA